MQLDSNYNDWLGQHTLQYRRRNSPSSCNPAQSSSPLSILTDSTKLAYLLSTLLTNQTSQRQVRQASFDSTSSYDYSRRSSFSPPLLCVPEVQQQQQQQQSIKSLYKTELCKRFLLSSTNPCKYGSRCRFAHGLHELHLSARHPRYKTEICHAFLLTGTCRYGRRCDFIHDETEDYLRVMRTENDLYLQYCTRHPNAVSVTLLEVLREVAPEKPELQRLLKHIESQS